MQKKIRENVEVLKEFIKQNKGSIILSLVFIFIAFAGYEYYKNISILRDPNKIKKIILSYGNYSILVFLIFQVIQVIAFFIPGEVIQIAGGYIYGTFLGTVFSIIGITIGSMLVYTLSRLYGRPLVQKIISTNNLKFFDRVLNIGRINLVVFLLYLIPGIPKDALGYICGVSDIKTKDFFVLSTIGRIPGVIVSSYFGANINQGKKPILIVIAVISTLLFILGILKGEKIIKKLEKK